MKAFFHRAFHFKPVPSEDFGFPGYVICQAEVEDDNPDETNILWLGNKVNTNIWHTFFPDGVVYIACERPV